MTNYYAALQAKSHAFLLQRRMEQHGIECEMAFLPRYIMKDLCNMGVKFSESSFSKALQVIKSSGLPSCRVYREEVFPKGCKYSEVNI
jgi:hypothetical protein